MHGREVFEPGRELGDLVVERLLGRGAFACVYLAEDRLIGRRIALKVVYVDDGGSEDEERRAVKEARAVGQLNSPQIVTLFRVHAPGDVPAWMFEMEYVPGGTLADALADDAALAPDRAAALAREIAAGLGAAHEHGVVHGDVKPGNVLLDDAGAAKIADFGLARLHGDASLSLGAGEVGAGTPVYMAPELIMGERATPASDIWSYGVTLYRTLAGRMPFLATSIHGLFHAIHNATPPPLGGAVPPRLSEVVAHCLAKQPGDRPRSFPEILQRLDPPRPAAARPSRPRPPYQGAAPTGREAETKRLTAVLDRAEGGRGACVALVGEAGIGKTAVARHVAGVALARGFRWVEAHVSPLEGVLRPLLESLRNMLESVSAPDPGSDQYGSAADAIQKLLAEEAGPRLEDPVQTTWAMEQLLTGLANTDRLVVCIEDAHHANPEDVKLLKHLARYLPRAGIVFVVSARPAEEDASHAPLHELFALEGVELLRLERLSREATYRLLEERAGGARLEPEVADKVLGIAEGNPLFAAELMRHLEETGAVVQRGGALAPGPRWKQISLPGRFRELVARRLEGLPQEDRDLLDVAAVDGLTFDGEALAAVLDRPLLEVLRALQRLVRGREIVVPHTSGYRFANAMFQQALYADLAPALRRQIHESLAKHLRGRPAPDAERLGHHLLNARDAEAARPWLLQTARAAYQRQQFLRCIDLARRAGVESGSCPGSALLTDPEAVFGIAHSYENTGDAERAELLLQRLVEEARGASEVELELRAHVHLAATRYFVRGSESVDRSVLTRAAEQLPECLEVGRAHYILGLAAKYKNDLDEASSRFERADDVFTSLALDALHGSATHQRASVSHRQGRLKEAEALYMDAARICSSVGQRTNAAVSEVNAAYAAFHRGCVEQACELLERAVRVLRLEGAQNPAGHALAVLSRTRFALGDREGAEAAAETATATLTKTNYLPGLFLARYESAHLLATRGDLDGAADALRAAQNAAESFGDSASQITANALSVHLACWRRDLGAAESTAAACLDLATAIPVSREHGNWYLMLLEAVIYGLPAEWTDRILRVTGEPPDPAPELQLPRLLAAALSRRGEALVAAADGLGTASVGERRATMKLLATWLKWHSAAEHGDDAAAETFRQHGRLAAAELKHVWMEQAFVARA